MPKVSVVLPTYNEKENISDFISELVFYISKYLTNDFEIIVVDDNSPDKTCEEVQNYFREDSRIKLIRRLGEKNLAMSIAEGIRESKGDIVAWMDCDFSMPSYKLIELIRKLYEDYDIAVGSRFTKGGKDIRGPTDSWVAVLLSRLMNYFICCCLGYPFRDYTSGFTAVRRRVFNEIKIKGNYGEYFIDFIYNARKRGYKVIEIPYYCVPRRKGVSKTGNNLWDYLTKGWKYILLTLELRFRKTK